jgi:hypothetical protein
MRTNVSSSSDNSGSCNQVTEPIPSILRKLYLDHIKITSQAYEEKKILRMEFFLILKYRTMLGERPPTGYFPFTIVHSNIDLPVRPILTVFRCYV